jgi:dTDP-L-rhamnose 4-epimerase
VFPLARDMEDMNIGDFDVKCPHCKTTVFVLPTDESSQIHPTSVYGITKQMQEELILTCCKALDIPAVSFRYQNVYGPGQSLKNPYTGILSIFSTCLINNKDVNIFEDGMESRDFVYIDDVVDATIAGVEADLHDWLGINVGTGNATSVLNVARSLKTIYSSDSNIYISGNYRLGDIRHNIADITLQKELLHYSPGIRFEEGIERFSDWVKTQEINTLANTYEKSLIEMRNKGFYK